MFIPTEVFERLSVIDIIYLTIGARGQRGLALALRFQTKLRLPMLWTGPPRLWLSPVTGALMMIWKWPQTKTC